MDGCLRLPYVRALLCTLPVDLLEANRYALHITAHTPEDGSGSGTGIGGSFGKEFITPQDYGPGSDVIDTRKPFRVSTYFAAGGPGGTLSAIEVTLRGDSGWELTMNMTDAACACVSFLRPQPPPRLCLDRCLCPCR